MTEVRRVRVCFPGDVLVWFLRDENVVRAALIRNGLPPTARFVACWDEKGTINLVFEDNSFPLADSENVPILVPQFTEMRSGVERRSGMDRRTGTDRRDVPK